jgi:branched-chain amino acid transport system permease protein
LPSAELLGNAIASGILLGGFYAAVALGLAIVFGQLDIVNIAHPAFIVVGAYVAYIVNSKFGFDPILIGLGAAPLFFLVGALFYRIYFLAFERTGQESLSGLAFFFGVMFIIEVVLIMIYGVDYRLVQADYIGQTWSIGAIGLPLRMLVPSSWPARRPAVVCRAPSWMRDQAVSQDRLALQLMGADPVKIKQWAFGLGVATAAIAGAMLIVIGPVEPSVGRQYIGRAFAIVVLGGMGSIQGMFIAALLLGVIETLVATLYGPSWAPAVSFGVLALTLALRPSGLFGRA